jgi:hypothetical protein
MEAFCILDCEILWNKQNSIPKSHIKAIKEELKTMAPQIGNALKFTTENQGSIVTYEVKPKIKTEWFYGITIFSGINDLRQNFLKILVQGGNLRSKLCGSCLHQQQRIQNKQRLTQ